MCCPFCVDFFQYLHGTNQFTEYRKYWISNCNMIRSKTGTFISLLHFLLFHFLSFFQSLDLTPCCPALSLTALPHFGNRRLEINSTLVWPETLLEIKYEWLRLQLYLLLGEMYDGSWVCVFRRSPQVNSHAISCRFYTSAVRRATLSH